MYKVNHEFTCAARRFKLPVPLQEDVAQRDNVKQDRTIAIEAAIVRVMKARKNIAHSQLVAEVLSNLQFFYPQPQDIKKCIENLITREFIARDETKGQLDRYTYLS